MEDRPQKTPSGRSTAHGAHQIAPHDSSALLRGSRLALSIGPIETTEGKTNRTGVTDTTSTIVSIAQRAQQKRKELRLTFWGHDYKWASRGDWIPHFDMIPLCHFKLDSIGIADSYFGQEGTSCLPHFATQPYPCPQQFSSRVWE